MTGSAAPGRRGRPPGHGKLAPFKAALIGWVEAMPDITTPTRLPHTLDDALGRVCRLFEPTECSNYFRAAGYGSK